MKNGLRTGLLTGAALLLVSMGAVAMAQPSADERAEAAVGKMTLDEKLSLVFGYFASDWQGKKPPAEARYGSAGYVP
ncbi:MAG TPA: hypothetical protein VK192_11030, partial [Sphingomicrobium sp.]|nr:hypothetical protein [Sphingomicrobium sp.]